MDRQPAAHPGSVSLTMRKQFVIVSVVVVASIVLWGLVWPSVRWLLVVVLPLIAIGVYDMLQTRHTLWRNFPLISRGRWIMEFFRPFMRQYLLESDTDGVPISRMFRSVVYQRAKGVRDTAPFGTKFDVYAEGYEWVSHSLGARSHGLHGPTRITIGEGTCSQPYQASLLNISAMSFGSLSDAAIRALNGGAALSGFAHNTGEGGISPYHLEPGGDLIWQLGTGYFGARATDGTFDSDKFAQCSAQPSVKMIEIKLSQGAKPGHGGILPAAKNTEEIARIRGVEPYTAVNSPPDHSAFSSPLELMQFIERLRELSGGKPIGIKLCIGRASEFVALCKAMHESGSHPDFITIDGGEGGSGAAPLEFTNSIGMPLRDAIAFVCDCLVGFDLKHKVRVIAVGRIFTAFHIARLLALGADTVYSARGMMMALGCVQSLICNTNHCPTGIATQQKSLSEGLVIEDKRQRVARFHDETLERLDEIACAAGLSSPSELNRTHIFRRVDQSGILRYDEIFPYLESGCLLDASEPVWEHGSEQSELPAIFIQALAESSSDSFTPRHWLAQHQAGLRTYSTAL